MYTCMEFIWRQVDLLFINKANKQTHLCYKMGNKMGPLKKKV